MQGGRLILGVSITELSKWPEEVIASDLSRELGNYLTGWTRAPERQSYFEHLLVRTHAGWHQIHLEGKRRDDSGISLLAFKALPDEERGRIEVLTRMRKMKKVAFSRERKARREVAMAVALAWVDTQQLHGTLTALAPKYSGGWFPDLCEQWAQLLGLTKIGRPTLRWAIAAIPTAEQILRSRTTN